MMNFSERLARDIARAARMTMAELDDAIASGENRTVSQLTAFSLARKAAEGGTDALKMIRELVKWEPDKTERAKKAPTVELRVTEPDEAQKAE